MAPSRVTLNGDIRTSGDTIVLGDAGTPVILAGTTSILDATNNGINTSGAGITIGGKLDGTLANTQSLTVNGGMGGTIEFGSTVGTTIMPATLEVKNSNGTTF